MTRPLAIQFSAWIASSVSDEIPVTQKVRLILAAHGMFGRRVALVRFHSTWRGESSLRPGGNELVLGPRIPLQLRNRNHERMIL